MSLMAEVNARALALGIPISAQLDITYRCNERCEHCYLDHEDKGELELAEIKDVLDQLAAAGVFFLTISGGEPFLRQDCFEMLAHARSLLFNVKLKSNAVLIGEAQARRLRELGIEQVQVSIYSHRPEVHDGITRLPGSLQRSLAAVRFLKAQGLKVSLANVLMRQNMDHHLAVRELARELDVNYTLDPTVTPMMDGDSSIVRMRAPEEALREAFRNPEVVGNVEEFCAPPAPVDDDVMNGLPCSAGHTACYISPYGDVYPCVQFPLPSGNVRRQSFSDIWEHSPELKQVRAISARDLPTCSGCMHLASCTRCPGLAYMEGDMRGPSAADCEKSFARTGIPATTMPARGMHSSSPLRRLVQIGPVSGSGL